MIPKILLKKRLVAKTYLHIFQFNLTPSIITANINSNNGKACVRMKTCRKSKKKIKILKTRIKQMKWYQMKNTRKRSKLTHYLRSCFVLSGNTWRSNSSTNMGQSISTGALAISSRIQGISSRGKADMEVKVTNLLKNSIIRIKWHFSVLSTIQSLVSTPMPVQKHLIRELKS